VSTPCVRDCSLVIRARGRDRVLGTLPFDGDGRTLNTPELQFGFGMYGVDSIKLRILTGLISTMDGSHTPPGGSSRSPASRALPLSRSRGLGAADRRSAGGRHLGFPRPAPQGVVAPPRAGHGRAWQRGGRAARVYRAGHREQLRTCVQGLEGCPSNAAGMSAVFCSFATLG
jgi:hypothetical protein